MNEITQPKTRREIMRLGGSVAAALALGGAQLQAAAKTRRILVHVNLFGGNDSNNMLVPLSSAAYSVYESARGPLAVSQRNLWPIAAPSGSVALGMPGELAELRSLYERKALAFVANTGYLPASDGGKSIPAGAMDPVTPMLAYVKDGGALPAWAPAAFNASERADLVSRTIVLDGGISMLASGANPMASPGEQHSTVNHPAIVKAVAHHRVRSAFPASHLGAALEKVAQLIAATPDLGISGGVILVGASQFDTFVNQADYQPALYRDLSASLAAFHSAMEELGVSQNVTLYTQTEFNRTLVPNSHLGTNPAWGGHQLVLGGAVLGGNVYGTFPNLTPGGPNDALSNGTWVPTTSHTNYASALTTWLGIESTPSTLNLFS